ncbi:unnamed protein product [Closterium sp. NIES-64]|nr:unnamed protein product [Closterium sp. NIES-64]
MATLCLSVSLHTPPSPPLTPFLPPPATMSSLTVCSQTATAGKPESPMRCLPISFSPLPLVHATPSDDEFFDRVQSNRHRRQARIALGGVKSAGEGPGAAGGAGGAAGSGGRKGGGGGVVTAVDLLEERHGLLERLREVEGQVAEERRRSEEASGGEGGEGGRVGGEGEGGGEGGGGAEALDPLDAFMSAVTTKIGTLTREAARLSGELERVAALLQLADPSGEAEAKWVPPVEKGKKRQKETTTLPAPAAPATAAATASAAEKGGGKEVKRQDATGGRGSELVTAAAQSSSAPVRTEEAADVGIQGRDGNEGSAAAEVEVGKMEEKGRGGGRGEARKQETAGGIVGGSKIDEKERVGGSKIDEKERVGGSKIDEKESVGGRKRGGGGDFSDGESRSKRSIADGAASAAAGAAVASAAAGAAAGAGAGAGAGSSGGGGGGGGEEKRRRVLGPAKPKFLEEAAAEMEQGTEAWMPPQGQTGDGQTLLNKKLGY